MTKTYCDICGKEATKHSSFEFEISSSFFNRYESIKINLDICDDCKNSSGLLEEIWSASDIKDSNFEDLFKEKIIKMIKEK